jgi:hypothetical protein
MPAKEITGCFSTKKIITIFAQFWRQKVDLNFE